VKKLLKYGCSILGLIWLATMSSSCSLPNPITGEIQQRKQRWIAQNIVDYRYILENSCFCIPEVTQPVKIEVRDGKRVAIAAVKDGRSVNEEYFTHYDTIPKLFDLIQTEQDKKPSKIFVSYDLKLGFPVSIFVDRSENIADEEIRLDVYGFEVIKSPN